MTVKSFAEIMKELRGSENDRDAINRALREYGDVSTRIALLGLATQKRLYNPWWIGCPPAVFLSYKWNGPASRNYVQTIHDYLTNLGYAVYFDKNELAEDAHAFTEVPQYISKIAAAQYYLLILTEKTADYIDARHNKTSWLFDEYQQAVMLVNAGRLLLVPLLVEEKGATSFFTKSNTIDISADPANLEPLKNVFWPVKFNLPDEHKETLGHFLDACDARLMQQNWDGVAELFIQFEAFKNFPDYQFRLLIYSICRNDTEMINACARYVGEFTGYDKVQRLVNSYIDLYKIGTQPAG